MASITRETGRAGPRNRGDVACGIYLPDSVVEQIRNEDVPGEIDGQSGGVIEGCGGGNGTIATETGSTGPGEGGHLSAGVNPANAVVALICNVQIVQGRLSCRCAIPGKPRGPCTCHGGDFFLVQYPFLVLRSRWLISSGRINPAPVSPVL